MYQPHPHCDLVKERKIPMPELLNPFFSFFLSYWSMVHVMAWGQVSDVVLKKHACAQVTSHLSTQFYVIKIWNNIFSIHTKTGIGILSLWKSKIPSKRKKIILWIWAFYGIIIFSVAVYQPQPCWQSNYERTIHCVKQVYTKLNKYTNLSKTFHVCYFIIEFFLILCFQIVSKEKANADI